MSYASEVHKTLHEMAEHIAGERNLKAQVMVQATILGDPKLYRELHRRTRERLQSANVNKERPTL